MKEVDPGGDKLFSITEDIEMGTKSYESGPESDSEASMKNMKDTQKGSQSNVIFR